jgi:TetR/AcrR family transcriptional regulator, tetracycline repressor protein
MNGLSRASLVSAALGLVQDEGLEALTMRGLADRLNVKAASLYWHVRDRRELLELLAESILEKVPVTGGAGWRPSVLNAAAALRTALALQQDADRILLEVPEAIQRSDVYLRLKSQLEKAGMQPAEAADVARLVVVHVISSRTQAGEPAALASGATASIAVDSGSRGVVLRHGSDMETLIRVPRDPHSASPAVVRGETVKVRRLRGVGYGEIELNPRHPWRFQVQGPTWNTVLDVGGLEVREIKLDSGAAKVEMFLPQPRGVVPIEISGGVAGVTLHRPPGVAVVADVGAGAVQVKLDGYSTKAVIADMRWESAGAAGAADRYELRIHSGVVVQVTLDEKATSQPRLELEPEHASAGKSASALEILLDGVESRLRRGG